MWVLRAVWVVCVLWAVGVGAVTAGVFSVALPYDQDVVGNNEGKLQAVLSGTPTGQVSYRWTEISTPTRVADMRPAGNTLSFLAPNQITDFHLQVEATDEDGSTATAAVHVWVRSVASVDAGPDTQIKAGSVYRLKGALRNLSALSGEQYAWQQTAGPQVTLQTVDAQTVSFTAPMATAELRFKLTASSYFGWGSERGFFSGDDEVIVQVDSSVIAADLGVNAGADQNVRGHDWVTLTAQLAGTPSGSVNYTWVQLSGTPASFSADGASLYFEAPNVADTLVFRVDAADQGSNSGSDEVTVTLSPRAAPQAVTSAPATVRTGQPLLLQASGSQVGDWPYAFYEWVQLDGPQAMISDMSAADLSFTAPSAGGVMRFRVKVCVTLSEGCTASDSAEIAVNVLVPGVDDLPVAQAGVDQTVRGLDKVHLDGGTSFSPAGDTLTYAWLQSDGTPVTLCVNGATACFDAPNTAETLTFSLTVTDGRSQQAVDSVQITINPRPQPVAAAGSDQSVRPAEVVLLQDAGSSHPEGLSLNYAWRQVSGTPVTLTDATQPGASFSAPAVSGVLEFALTVSDSFGLSSEDLVQVTVDATPLPPVADAGPDLRVRGLDEVRLDASASRDPDGSALSFVWQQTAGTPLTLNADGPRLQFSADNRDETLRFQVTVTNEQGLSALDEVEVQVMARRAPVAVAGPDQTLPGGSVVTLSPAASTHPDGSAMTYRWAQDSGPAAQLIDTPQGGVSFTTLERGGTYWFTLTASDSYGQSASDKVMVTVLTGDGKADGGGGALGGLFGLGLLLLRRRR